MAEEKVKEQVGKAPAKAKEEKPVSVKEEPKSSGKLVKVYNPQRYFYVQPSTGIRINAQTVTEVRDDNWVALQVGANILQRK